MKRLALPLIFLFLACNGPPPPPDPCDDEKQQWPFCESTGGEWIENGDCTCECPDGLKWVKGSGCQPKIPPPPPPLTCADKCAPFQGVDVAGSCRCSNDYYVMTRARKLHVEATNWDARLIYNGVRHPHAAYEQCGDDVLPYNGYTSWDQIWPVSNRAGEAKVHVFGADASGTALPTVLDSNRRRVDLVSLMRALHAREIQSVLLEGGRQLATSMFAEGLVDKVISFVAPKIIGGSVEGTPLLGWGASTMDRTVKLTDVTLRQFGDNVCIEGQILRSQRSGL